MALLSWCQSFKRKDDFPADVFLLEIGDINLVSASLRSAVKLSTLLTCIENGLKRFILSFDPIRTYATGELRMPSL
jgi:hypothetical protein